jgi:CHAT domain-containing protein
MNKLASSLFLRKDFVASISSYEASLSAQKIIRSFLFLNSNVCYIVLKLKSVYIFLCFQSFIAKSKISEGTKSTYSGLVACYVKLDQLHDACRFAHEQRAQSLVELMLESSPDSSILTSIEQEWIAKRKQLQGMHMARETLHSSHNKEESVLTAMLDQELALRQVIKELEDKITKSNPFFVSKFQVQTMTHPDMQAALGTNTMALMFYFSTSWNGAFVIARGLAQPRLLEYSKEDVLAINTCIQKCQQKIKEHKALDSLLMQELSLAIKLDALLTLLRENADTFYARNYSHLVILPHGVLTSLPLHILPTTAGTTLNDVFSNGVFYLPSLHLLSKSADPGCETLSLSNLLVVQDPTNTLLCAATEVVEISKEFNTCIVLKDEEASIQVFREQVQKASPNSTLHFACHGVFDQQSRWNTQLQLDAPLTIADIILSHDLKKFNLCVLSACESAVSDVTVNDYDDYISIASSFIAAGVPRVLSALWKVDDTATSLLMIQLYRAIRQPSDCDARACVSLTTALKKAQYYLRTLKGRDVKLQVQQQALHHTRGDVTDAVKHSSCVKIRYAEFSEDEKQAKQAFTECIDASLIPRAVSRNPGAQFKESHWLDFLTAFRSDAHVLVYSHVFPVKAEKNAGDRYLPERDLWYRVCY